MISHPPFSDGLPRGVVLFAELMGMTCSVCAPEGLTPHEVEASAMVLCRPANGPWLAVDKSRPPISIGDPTPNPCNVYAGRKHWFLISGGADWGWPT